jgi:hypothetical protein
MTPKEHLECYLLFSSAIIVHASRTPDAFEEASPQHYRIYNSTTLHTGCTAYCFEKNCSDVIAIAHMLMLHTDAAP